MIEKKIHFILLKLVGLAWLIALVVLAILLAALVAVLKYIVQTNPVEYWFVLFLVSVGYLLIFPRIFLNMLKYSEYSKIYQDKTVARNMANKKLWQGQSAEQLFLSLGKPHAIEDKQLKTKEKEIWKYQHEGHNRYRLRVTVTDGVVSDWTAR